MTLNPLQPEFWANENNLLWSAMVQIVMAALFAGAESAFAMLPDGVAQLINIEMFNAQAISYLQQYQLTTVPGINETTSNQAVQLINEWLLSGNPIQSLETALTPIFGDTRASAIAVTEITRAYAMGNQLLWASSGVVGGKEWRTANDERVCPICGTLDGTVVDINSEWQFNANEMAASPQMKVLLGDNYSLAAGLRRANSLLKHIGTSSLTPPAHVNCLPGDSLVLPIGGVSAGSKRWYEGDVVTIVTLENQLTVTPNHPILTRRGWVAAGEINQGDDIIGYSVADWEASLVSVDNQHVVSSIKDVFSSLDLADFRMPTATPDFHGDGAGSDVAVIRANGKVVGGTKFQIGHPPSNHNFFLGDVVSQVPFTGFGAIASLFDRHLAPLSGGMSRFNLHSPLACGHSAPFDLLGSGLPAGINTSLQQTTAESMTIDTGLFSEFVLGFPFDITLQKVVEVRNNYFSGHVYNLQTDSGMYVADGIITHNCRCWMQPVVSEVAFEDQIDIILSQF